MDLSKAEFVYEVTGRESSTYSINHMCNTIRTQHGTYIIPDYLHKMPTVILKINGEDEAVSKIDWLEELRIRMNNEPDAINMDIDGTFIYGNDNLEVMDEVTKNKKAKNLSEFSNEELLNELKERLNNG